ARAGRRPLEHLQVAVRITERRDRPSPDGGLDADWLPRPVVDEVDLGPLDEHRAAFAGFERHLHSRADDLFGWNAVDPFGERTEEFDPATRHDERLEPVRAQVRQ